MTHRKIKGLSGLRMVLLAAGAAVLSGALATAPAFAQDNTPPPPPPPPPQGQGGPGGGGYGGRMNPAEMQQRQLDRMTRELALTPEQVTQIKAIQTDGMARMQALRADTTVAPEDKRPKMMQMRKDEQTKIRAVLTSDQQTKYDAMLAHERERGPRGEGAGGPPPPPPPPPPSL